MNISELLQQQHYLLSTLYGASVQHYQQVDQAKQHLDQQVNQAKQRLERWLKEIEEERSDSKRKATDVYREVKDAYFQTLREAEAHKGFLKSIEYEFSNRNIRNIEAEYYAELKRYIAKVEDEYIAMQRKPDLTLDEYSIRSQMQDFKKIPESSIYNGTYIGCVFSFLAIVIFLFAFTLPQPFNNVVTICIIPIILIFIGIVGSESKNVQAITQ